MEIGLIAQIEAEAGIQIDTFGGNCPVQAEGAMDGLRFYFRARGNAWQFHVAKTKSDIFNNDLFYHDEEYGDGPFDTGWMPDKDAFEHIAKGVELARTALKAKNQ